MYRIVMPRVIVTLLVINVAMWLLDLASHGLLTQYGSLISSKVIFKFEIWRIFSYLFLHSQQSFTHILFNMLMLWMFGSSVVLSLGEKSFLRFYLIAGVFAGLISVTFDLITGVYSAYIGASGAILAVLVFFGCQNPNQKIWIWGVFPLKAKWLVVLIVLSDVLFFGEDNIARISHLGGAFFGASYYFLFFRRNFQQFKIKINRLKLKDAEQREFILQKADLLLKKISIEGIQSLSEKEKNILQKASEIRKQNQSIQQVKRKNFYGE